MIFPIHRVRDKARNVAEFSFPLCWSLHNCLVQINNIYIPIFLYIHVYQVSYISTCTISFFLIYLVVPGLNCSMWYLLVGSYEHLVMACRNEFSDQGSNLGPLHWEGGILATGTPGKSLYHVWYTHPGLCVYINIYYAYIIYLYIIYREKLGKRMDKTSSLPPDSSFIFHFYWL